MAHTRGMVSPSGSGMPVRTAGMQAGASGLRRDVGLPGLQHHAEQDAVLLPPFFDAESECLEEALAALPGQGSESLTSGSGCFFLDTPPVGVKIWRPPGGNPRCAWTGARAMRKTTMAHLDRRAFLLGTTAALSAAVAPQIAAAAPARLGNWSEEKLAAFTRKARELGALGVVCLADGKTVVSDGEVSKPLRIASVRKSVLNALYGIAMTRQAVNLDATMSELGIDDYTPLTEAERQATVRDLFKARSGIYISTAAETPAMRAARPKRGSHAPGTFWYYNNWDLTIVRINGVSARGVHGRDIPFPRNQLGAARRAAYRSTGRPSERSAADPQGLPDHLRWPLRLAGCTNGRRRVVPGVSAIN